MRPTRSSIAAVIVVALVASTAVAVTRATAKPGPRHPTNVHTKKAKKAQNGQSAYAFVIPGEVSLNVDPVLVTARTRNIEQVTSPAAGVFCLRPAPPIDAPTRSWTVSPEDSRSSAPSKLLFAYADTRTSSCPAGWIGVRTYELKGPSLTATPSEHVAFMLVTG